MRANEFVKRNPGLLKRAQSCKSLEEFLNFVEKEQDKNWEEDHKENNKKYLIDSKT